MATTFEEMLKRPAPPPPPPGAFPKPYGFNPGEIYEVSANNDLSDDRTGHQIRITSRNGQFITFDYLTETNLHKYTDAGIGSIFADALIRIS